MTAAIINFRDHLQSAPPTDHGCIKLTNGRCPLCEVRSLEQVRAERARVELPADCEAKDFAE